MDRSDILPVYIDPSTLRNSSSVVVIVDMVLVAHSEYNGNMCNRYRAAKDKEALRRLFNNAPEEWFDELDEKYTSFYPKSNVPVVLKVRQSNIVIFNGGSFLIGQRRKAVLTNTKSEEALIKPTWRKVSDSEDA